MSASGLRTRPRKNGTVAYYWIASAASRQAGDYPFKTRTIRASSLPEAEAAAWAHTAELRKWLQNPETIYDGTMGSLIVMYATEETSDYFGVKENTRASYDHDLKVLKRHVAKAFVAALTRRDFMRWWKHFAEPAEDGGTPRIRRAHGVMTMVRMLLSFGQSMQYEGCVEANAAIEKMTFEQPARREVAMTYEQAAALVEQALAEGARSMALGQALQFELGLRQIDVVGQWVDDPEARGTSGLKWRGTRWEGGITWADLKANQIAKRTSKTGQEGVWTPSLYPLLVKAMAAFADDEKLGPAVIDERAGRPYLKGEYGKRWRPIADRAGVPGEVWNMDSRAGAVTEAGEAGARDEDTRKFATHANVATTHRYVRKTAEATNRVAKKRVAFRARRQK